jgi:hypothetical protein
VAAGLRNFFSHALNLQKVTLAWLNRETRQSPSLFQGMFRDDNGCKTPRCLQTFRFHTVQPVYTVQPDQVQFLAELREAHPHANIVLGPDSPTKLGRLAMQTGITYNSCSITVTPTPLAPPLGESQCSIEVTLVDGGTTASNAKHESSSPVDYMRLVGSDGGIAVTSVAYQPQIIANLVLLAIAEPLWVHMVLCVRRDAHFPKLLTLELQMATRYRHPAGFSSINKVFGDSSFFLVDQIVGKAVRFATRPSAASCPVLQTLRLVYDPTAAAEPEVGEMATGSMATRVTGNVLQLDATKVGRFMRDDLGLHPGSSIELLLRGVRIVSGEPEPCFPISPDLEVFMGARVLYDQSLDPSWRTIFPPTDGPWFRPHRRADCYI